MWFLFRRLRRLILLAIALPLARMVVHHLAIAAENRKPRTRTAKALHHADSAVNAVSRRTSRKAGRTSRRARR
jgi:hypothetical protein